MMKRAGMTFLFFLSFPHAFSGNPGQDYAIILDARQKHSGMTFLFSLVIPAEAGILLATFP
jgi:hypothetical protein